MSSFPFFQTCLNYMAILRYCSAGLDIFQYIGSTSQTWNLKINASPSLFYNHCNRLLFSSLSDTECRFTIFQDFLFFQPLSWFPFSRRVSNILAYCYLFSLPHISRPGIGYVISYMIRWIDFNLWISTSFSLLYDHC